jgi:hypothetical protein
MVNVVCWTIPEVVLAELRLREAGFGNQWQVPVEKRALRGRAVQQASVCSVSVPTVERLYWYSMSNKHSQQHDPRKT